MKPYTLYEVEVAHNCRYVTTVSARSSDEAHRKAWKKIAKKSPKLVPFFHYARPVPAATRPRGPARGIRAERGVYGQMTP